MPPPPPSLGLGLGLPFVRGGGARLDPDAAAYIALITAAGADLGLLNEEAITKKAISDSIIERKDLHLWELERRFYMPIWGIAAANAICMRSLTSGTFVGGVTHGAGFVQGNGSTGYFDLGVTASALGQTTSSMYLAGLLLDALGASEEVLGSRNSASQEFRHTTISNTVSRSVCGSVGVNGTAAPRGIYSTSRTAAHLRQYQRVAGERTQIAETTTAAAGTIPTGNLFGSAANISGSASQFCNKRIGSLVAGAGLTDAQDSAFTANLKTLWETCTVLSLIA
jgi:hypothetical protein